MAGKGPLNYSTKIAAKVTAQECLGMLGTHGAERVGLSYKDRQPSGLEFQIETRWGMRHYAVPVDVDGTAAALALAIREGRVSTGGQITLTRLRSREHAANVAWRVTRDWLEVNIAMIEAGLANLERAMLSYQLVEPGKDMFAAVDEQERKAIGGA